MKINAFIIFRTRKGTRKGKPLNMKSNSQNNVRIKIDHEQYRKATIDHINQ